MTKLKSKKMTKSTFAIIIMAIAMVAMLAFGGTYAYFTDSVETALTGSVTTGHVEIAMGTNATISKAFDAAFAVPGDTLWEIDLDLDTSKSNVATYVFATWTLTNADSLVLTTEVAKGSSWALVEGETNVYYLEVAANTEKDTVTFTGSVVLATSNGNDTMDKTVSCSVSFATTQQDHLTPAEAYALVSA